MTPRSVMLVKYNNLIYALLYTSLFCALYLSFYNQITSGQSDLITHALLIQDHINGSNEVAYPLWHEVVYLLHRISGLPITISAVLVNTLNVLIFGVLVHYFSITFLGKKTNALILIMIIISCLFAGNFFLPELNITKYHLAGNGAIAVWHNPTLFAVKPFAVSAFFLFFIGLEKKSTPILILSSALAIASIFAKPIFIIVFIPSLIIYLIFLKFRKIEDTGPIQIYLIATSVISFACIIFIYYKLYLNSPRDVDIVIAPFAVWEHYSNNIIISIYVTNLFLTNFLFLSFRNVSVRSLVATLMVAISYMVFAIFAESRNSEILMDGNFGWLSLCAIPIAFLSTLIDYFKSLNKISYWKITVLNFSLAIQIVFGFYYYYKFLTSTSIL